MPSPNTRPSDRDVEEIARRAARDEVERIAWRVVYFVLGFSLVYASVLALAGANGPLTAENVAFTLVGVGLFCAGAYFLAATFELDRAVLRWAKRHA